MDPTVFTPKIKQWKENIERLLFKNNVCGICLSEDQHVINWDTIYHIEISKKERTLRDIISLTFGNQVASLMPTKYICETCVTTILQSYFIIKKVRSNHIMLQKYINILTQQAMVTTTTEQQMEKQLLLTIDNVNSLNVPTTVTVSKKEKRNNITQIFLCEVDGLDAMEPEFNFDNYHLKYECPYCGKQFQEYVLFKDHYTLHNEVYFRCHKCAKRYKYFNDLIKHRNNKHSDCLSVCDICKIILLSPESREHEQEHPENTCLICQIKFRTESDLQFHNAQSHSHVTCQKCQKTFSNSLKLEHHSYRCPYKCSECKDDCVHEKYLTSYREQHMVKGMTMFKCPDCEFIYTTKSQIICHANEEHLNHLPYLCDLCGESFASRPNLRSHMYKKHADVSLVFDDWSIKEEGPIVSSVLSERPFECDLCGFCFNSEETYITHRKKHLTEQTKCRFCKKMFCNIGQLNIHIKKSHPDEFTNRNIIYCCAMCPLDFKCRAEILKHISTHPKGTPHTCRKCKETFLSKKNYMSHIRKHRIAYDKSCPICFKKYTKHTISRHMRRLHGIQNENDSSSFICDVCAEVLPNENALLKHADKHTEVRECPHCQLSVNSVLYSKHVSTHIQNNKQYRQCSDCNYTTKFAVCLEAHINRHHRKVRPYQCDICNKTFYSDYTLKGHKATHKDVRPELYCHICGKKFISKKALTFHTRIHTGEQPYPCDLCDLSFLSTSRRRQHLIRKHFEPQFECQICFKKLFTQSDLRRHVGDCHDGESKRKKAKKSDSLYIEMKHKPDVT